MIAQAWLLLLLGWGAVSTCFALLWAWCTRRGDASAVDAMWGYGLAVLGSLYAILGDGAAEHRLLLGVLAGLTGIKIGTFVLVTRVLGREEDGRYARLRAKWGDRATRRFLVFFQAQAFLDLVLSVPFALAVGNDGNGIEAVEVAGAAVWVVASVGESLADRQLARFRAEPANRGRVCTVGLWRFSRHPNYFFQICTWVAFALVALAAPYGWIGLVAPLVITASIVLVTGIPPTEAQAVRSRGDAYRAYQRTTPVLLPWLPRRDARPPTGLARLVYWIPPETGRGR
jgi:steroid 5-alpha reductase family enzyme